MQRAILHPHFLNPRTPAFLARFRAFTSTLLQRVTAHCSRWHGCCKSFEQTLYLKGSDDMKPVSRVNTTEENIDQSQSRSQERSQDRSQEKTPEARDENRPAGASFAAPDLNAIGKTINSYVDQAKDVASDVVSKAQGYGSDALDETSSFIRKYPGQTLAAGFGLGVLLGITLARR
jgi:ElaB/YqjD/DUF883 family membrane-anchored ribosome-binding protein